MTILPLCLVLVLSVPGQQAPPSGSSDVPRTQASAAHSVLSRVILVDGQELRGFVVRRDERLLVLELVGGESLELPLRTVARVEEELHARVHEGEIWHEDPNRTHYFYAPSGMMLRRGEGSLSQGLLSLVNYGLLDHLTLQAGTVVPLYALELFNVLGGVKVGGSLGDRVHLAMGAQVIFSPPFTPSQGTFVLGTFYGTATYGTPNAHLSLTAALPFERHGLVSPIPFFAISGNLRVSQHLALVTENWMLFSPSRLSPEFFLPSAGVRILGEHWSVALGVVYLSNYSSVPPLPWVDIAYHFGG